MKRVSRKSKKWIAASENKICDAPGSWYCVGQYPPALDKLMAKKEAFTQLEDFNAKKGKRNLFLLYFTIIYLLVNIILYMLTFIEKLYNIFNSFFYFTNKNKSRTEEMVSLSSFQR